jgi:hypothetical protein
MNAGQWMRVLDTVGSLVQLSERLRRPTGAPLDVPPVQRGGPVGQLEARLAGVVVAALKEAFDRDRVRMDLERSQFDAERLRAEAALRAELRRQAAERALTQLRLIAVIAAAVWMLSAALGVWLPNMRAPVPLVLMGSGWALAIGALGCALGAWQRVAGWSADMAVRAEAGESSAPSSAGGFEGPRPPAPPGHRAAAAALGLLLVSLALTGAALLSAL